MAGSAHCTSSIEISIGLRKAARSSDSCSSRSIQKRWSGEWLRSRSTAGSTGGSSACDQGLKQRAQRYDLCRGVTRAAEDADPAFGGHVFDLGEQDALAHPGQPRDQDYAAASRPHRVELAAQRLDLDLAPPKAKGHPPLLIQLGNRQPKLVTARLALEAEMVRTSDAAGPSGQLTQ